MLLESPVSFFPFFFHQLNRESVFAVVFSRTPKSCQKTVLFSQVSKGQILRLWVVVAIAHWASSNCLMVEVEKATQHSIVFIAIIVSLPYFCIIKLWILTFTSDFSNPTFLSNTTFSNDQPCEQQAFSVATVKLTDKNRWARKQKNSFGCAASNNVPPLEEREGRVQL